MTSMSDGIQHGTEGRSWEEDRIREWEEMQSPFSGNSEGF